MTDLSKTIAPKSDQTNADDLIAGPRTIKVTRVSLCAEPDQPISINYEGDNGKPFKPCKSMRRVLVQVWGSDGNSFIGRSMTLYRDDKVQFGGMAVGGIRISHMSHIDTPITMALTASKAKRAPFIVKPLVIPAAVDMAEIKQAAKESAEKGRDELTKFWKSLGHGEKDAIKDDMKALGVIADEADKSRGGEPLRPPPLNRNLP